MSRQLRIAGTPASGQAKGQLRHAAGREAEKAFEAAHDACHRAGLVSPWLRGDPGIRVGAGGRAVFRDSAAIDYTATLRPSGRSLVVEVKACDGDRWAYDHLAAEQADALDAAGEAGALALVVIVRAGRLYPLPWPELRPLWWAWHRDPGRRPGQRCLPGTASLPFDLIALRAVRPGTTYLTRYLPGETR